MSKFSYNDIVLAFAGVHQAAVLIHQIASTGRCDEQAFDASINSIFFIDAPNVSSIYGGKHNLLLGMRHLQKILNGQISTTLEKQIARLVMSLIHIERQLSRDSEKLQSLQKKIIYAKSQAEFFNPTHPAVIAALAKVYEDIVSPLSFKIGVVGKRELLSNNEIMHKVRALLLAGIRSAVLWQQVGGNRWQLLFYRQKYKNVLNQLIK